MSKAAFSINSALAFASAELMTIAFHETGHGLVAQALGFSPRIYAFYENNPTGTAHQSLLILAGGPLASLVLGLLFLFWYRKGQARYDFGLLLLFWLAWLGIMEFVNYLIVTPWLNAGDTAQIADLLLWSLPARYGVAIAGIIMLLLLTGPAARDMFALAPEDVPLDVPADRRRFIIRGFYLPLIAGTALTALGGIGGPLAITGIGMLGTFGNIDLVAFSLFRVAGAAVKPRTGVAPLRVEPIAVLLYVALVAVYVFVISRGLPV
jgi:hypothetical protein